MRIKQKIKKFIDSEIALRKEFTNQESLRNQVWQVTGFKNKEAEKLISLLLRWHYYDKSKDTARQLAHYGVRVESEEQ